MSSETLALFFSSFTASLFFSTPLLKTPEAAIPGTLKKGKERRRVTHSNPLMLISAKMKLKWFMIQNYET